jgi:DNA-binding transcriptional regulator YiaG
MMTGAQLRAARERLELTQQQLADALEVHRVTVSEWESGRALVPQMATLALEALAQRAAKRRHRRTLANGRAPRSGSTRARAS